MNILHMHKQRFRFRFRYRHPSDIKAELSIAHALPPPKYKYNAGLPPFTAHGGVSREEHSRALCTQTVSNSGHMVHDERTTATWRDGGTMEQP